jgi:asparagine synthase (glutamine-hydrolysing)
MHFSTSFLGKEILERLVVNDKKTIQIIDVSMCGIAGILHFSSKPVELASIRAMTDAIAHRGPDGEGLWVDDQQRLALGHRRLSIIDLSDNASQPMHRHNRYSIVFNGEIYNYIELKEQLIQDGYMFSSDSDTEVLLTLFDQKKEACLHDLDGMFAFAIWDSIEETLFCARDRFGEKPFHYAFYEQAFYFGSEMKELWAAGVPKVKNENMFQIFRTQNQVHHENHLHETFYEGINRLVHSHWLKIRKDGTHEIQKYYDIEWRKQDCKLSFEEACLEFNRLFQLSLSRRFRADVPIGTSLSGGLDSSSIVCNIAQYNNVKQITPNTFSARFKGFKKDEGYFIDKVIEQTGFTPFTTWPSGEEMVKDMEKLCYHQEEPFRSASIYAQYRVQQLAKENKTTVLIDGQGADEILAGYVSYYYPYLQSLSHTLPYFSRYRIKEQHKFLDFHAPHKGLKKALIKGLMLYEVRNKLKPSSAYKSLNAYLYESTMLGPLQELLRYADRNSMAHSREVRLPFLFHELVEFCFSLPDAYKLNMGWTKFIMRNTFQDVLPPEICWRKEKVGFEPPQDEWLKNAGIEEDWYSFALTYF